MNNITYRHLTAFLAVARYGSFTQAAAHLHLTQSTLTSTIKQLEQNVQLQLFDRTTRQVSLSGEGARFQPVAERLVSDFDTALEDLRARAHQQRGIICVAASASLLSTLLPAVIKPYHRQYPEVRLQLREEGASLIEQAVLNNEADFGMGGNHSANPQLCYQPILHDQYGVVFAADHPLADSTAALSWSACLQQPLLLLSKDHGIRQQLDAWQCLAGARDGIEVSKPASLAPLVKQGLGVSILPALAVGADAFTGLQFRPLMTPVRMRTLYIITRQGRSLSPAAAQLLSRTQAYLTRVQLPEYVTLAPV